VPARHLFVVSHPERDRLASALTAAGIATGIHYPIPCHLQPALTRPIWRPSGDLSASEEAAGTVLSLPLYPERRDAGVERVAAALRAAL
jgi:dTDP-4-amino-4,6-dideoxygalactose transaminase